MPSDETQLPAPGYPAVGTVTEAPPTAPTTRGVTTLEGERAQLATRALGWVRTALGFDGVASAIRDHLDVQVRDVQVTRDAKIRLLC